MAKPIQNPCEDEPSALPFKTGGRLRRNQEYVIFYFLAIASWGCEIAAACLGSLYGAQSHYFIALITPFLVTHWYVGFPPVANGTVSERMAANDDDELGVPSFRHAG